MLRQRRMENTRKTMRNYDFVCFLNVIETITLTLIYGLERYRGSNKKVVKEGAGNGRTGAGGGMYNCPVALMC